MDSFFCSLRCLKLGEPYLPPKEASAWFGFGFFTYEPQGKGKKDAFRGDYLKFHEINMSSKYVDQMTEG